MGSQRVRHDWVTEQQPQQWDISISGTEQNSQEKIQFTWDFNKWQKCISSRWGKSDYLINGAGTTGKPSGRK